RPHEDPGSGAAGSREEHVPRASQEPEQRDRAEAEERKSSPPDRDGGRENGAEADVPDEVESERKPETCDDEGAPFHGIGSVRGALSLSLRAHETARESRQGRNRTGPQQTPIIRADAAVVLGETEPEKCGDIEVVADRFRPCHGEIVV